MIKINHWLTQNRQYNILILLVYYLLVVLPHEQVGLLTTWVFSDLTRPQYNLVMLGISITVTLLIVIPMLKRIVNHPEKQRILFFIVISLIFAIACFTVLFVVNVEAVHFIQYAVFAFLCFPLVQNYTHALIWSTLAGAFDEGYQFFYLAPERTPHYDWNDIIVNLIGAAFGLIILKIYQVNEVNRSFKLLRSPLFYTLGFIVILFVVLLSTGTLSIVQDPVHPTPLTLVKELPDAFWTILPKPYVKYHIVLPFEGLITTIALCVFYSRLNKS